MDRLSKAMAREGASPYAHAEQALHHFGDLHACDRSRDTDAQKAPDPGVRPRSAPGLPADPSLARAEALDTTGDAPGAGTPASCRGSTVWLWQHRTERTLLDTALTPLRQEQELTRQQVRQTPRALSRAPEEPGAAEHQLRNPGGDRREHLHRTRETRQNHMEHRRAARWADPRTHPRRCRCSSAPATSTPKPPPPPAPSRKATTPPSSGWKSSARTTTRSLHPLEKKIRHLHNEQATRTPPTSAAPPPPSQGGENL